jgi:hypothetical protein
MGSYHVFFFLTFKALGQFIHLEKLLQGPNRKKQLLQCNPCPISLYKLPNPSFSLTFPFRLLSWVFIILSGNFVNRFTWCSRKEGAIIQWFGGKHRVSIPKHNFSISEKTQIEIMNSSRGWKKEFM